MAGERSVHGCPYVQVQELRNSSDSVDKGRSGRGLTGWRVASRAGAKVHRYVRGQARCSSQVQHICTTLGGSQSEKLLRPPPPPPIRVPRPGDVP